MKVADAVAVAGHEVHVCRYREARTLLRWLGPGHGDLRGLRVLDVAGGDGYWAGQVRRRGAQAVALDLDQAKLTHGNLTGGKFIAGTGEISPDGTVSPIGGIQQKMAGARAAGATVFLTPAANCPDTAGAVPAGLRLVKVSTLNGAVHDLDVLKAGGNVPSC